MQPADPTGLARSPDPAPGGNGPAQRDLCAELIARLARRRAPHERFVEAKQIGEGAMGEIWRVHDEDLHRDLAMKVMKRPGERSGGSPRSPSASQQVARFVEEAQVTGQLDHPGIVPVHEIGLDAQGRLYFTMKLVRGRTLREVFDLAWKGAEGWSTTRALGVLLKVCEAMAYAHEHRVIHRDLKPSNIMVGRFGEVFVMDWGLARLLDRPDVKDIRVRGAEAGSVTELVSERREVYGTPDSPLVTMDGDVLGTPVYMSPEQARGDLDQVGVGTDVYALGAILYHLLARRMPYVDPGVRVDNYAVWRWVQQGPPEALERVAPRVPPDLVAVCERAMQREVHRRYESALQLAADLRAYLENRVVQAHRVGPVAELRKWVRRNALAASAIGAFVGAVLCGSLLVAWIERRRADGARQALDEQTTTELLGAADRLWPARPGRAPELRAWLEESGRLLARLPARRGELERLERDALSAGAARREPIAVPPGVQFAIAEALHRSLALDDARARRSEPRISAGAAPPGAVAAGELETLAAESAYWRGRAESLAGAEPVERLVFEDPSRARTHAKLEALVARLDRLAHEVVPEVRERLERADTIGRDTVEARAADWRQAIRSIADRAECPRYEGLVLAPQLGLVPLGRDARSGLWEFYLPESGARPGRSASGEPAPGPETALVFVLIPGGRTVVGAQKDDPAGERFDPDASLTEAPRAFDLAPYFLAKHELTQGQWYRLTRDVPSRYWSGMQLAGSPRLSRANPVENVSWREAELALARWGLTLPTEAQWEHAARAGTERRYLTSDVYAEVACSLNGADAHLDLAQSRVPAPGSPADGHAVHARAASFEPNAFGLHDVLGNVAEWCLDWYGDSCDVPEQVGGTGERIPAFSRTKSYRGGCFQHASLDLRVSRRLHLEPDSRDETIGVRAARLVDEP